VARDVEAQRRMKVFLSLSHDDRKAVEELIAQMSAAGLQVWDADREIQPGENWALEVGRALAQSDAMIVFLSPKSLRSPQVQHEVDFALTSPRYEGRVVVVEVKPTERIPWILRKFRPIRLYQSPARAAKHVISRVRHLAKATRHASRKSLSPA